MLQAGFGMSAFQSGSVTFIASVGAMAMKTTVTPILRIFGFRRVLVYDVILSAAFLGCYGFFTPATPMLLMMSLLLVGGFVRSLGFTSLNAIVFAEIEPARMSRAVSFSAAAQQLSLSVGIAMGAGALQGFAYLNPGMDVFALENFKWAFVTMALISLSAVAVFLRLPPDAGSNLIASRAEPSEVIAQTGQ
jgi:MFS family permease